MSLGRDEKEKKRREEEIRTVKEQDGCDKGEQVLSSEFYLRRKRVRVLCKVGREQEEGDRMFSSEFKLRRQEEENRRQRSKIGEGDKREKVKETKIELRIDAYLHLISRGYWI